MSATHTELVEGQMDWMLLATIIAGYVIGRAIVGTWNITFSLVGFKSAEEQKLVWILQELQNSGK